MYTVDPNAEEPIMLINKHIGFDENEGQGIMGDQFQAELMALDAMGKRRIEVWISSPGGSVMDGMIIYASILHSKCKVDTVNLFMAASIAAVIFQAGRTRIMCDYAKQMFHNPYGGDSSDLKPIKESLTIAIAERTGKTPDVISKMMDRTTWIGAQEAYNNGFCDEIEHSAEANKGRLAKISNQNKDAVSMWKESTPILNSIIAEKKQLNLFNDKKNNMLKVTNKLGLNPDANEESILTALNEVENKMIDAVNKKKATDEDLVKAKKALEDKKCEYDEMKEQFDSMKNGLEEKANKDKEEKETAMKNAADIFITDQVKVGKIKNEEAAILRWTNRYIGDPEGVKADLESMPLNKKSASLSEVTNKAGDNGKPLQMGSIVNQFMADKKAKLGL